MGIAGTGRGQASTHGVVARADDGGRRWRVPGIAWPRAGQGEDVRGRDRQNRAPRQCGRLRYLLKSSRDRCPPITCIGFIVSRID
jgi:hypothetical protein